MWAVCDGDAAPCRAVRAGVPSLATDGGLAVPAAADDEALRDAQEADADDCAPCPDVPAAPVCECESGAGSLAVVERVEQGASGDGDGLRDDDGGVEPCPAPAAAVQAAAVGVDALLQPASVAGKDPSKSELSCDDLLAIRWSPFTPQSGPQPLFIEWYYRCVYEPMVIKKSMSAKAIVWKRPPKETAGFGNQLRGQYGAFVLALVTRRLFLIDDQMMDFYFHSPPAVDWRFKTHQNLLPQTPKTVGLCPAPPSLFGLQPC